MDYDGFLAGVGQRGGPGEKDHADQAAKVVLATLGQRLAGQEPRDLASQLPAELQHPLLQHTGGGAELGDDLDDFLRRVADRKGRGSSTEDALLHARAVLATIASFVSAGEIEDLRTQLPTGYATLFEHPA